jgi:PTS system mannose-specific IID component
MKTDARRIGPGTLWRVALGGLALQAAFGPDRRQGLGVGAALAPVARFLPEEARSRFLACHLENYNTNPAMTGPLLGALVRLEEKGAGGDESAVHRAGKLKRGVEGPFASAGDALLWGGMRPGAALWGALAGWMTGAWGVVVFLVLYNVVHLGLRLGGVFWGYQRGASVDEILRSSRFRGLTVGARRLVMTGAGALALLALGPEGGPGFVGLAGLGLGVFLGVRGFAHGTLLALGGILFGLILAYGLGSQTP